MSRSFWKRFVDRPVKKVTAPFRVSGKIQWKSVPLRVEELESRLTPAGPPATVVFTTAAQTLIAGQPSGTMTVELEDASGNVAQAGTGGQTLNLSSTSAAGSFLNTSGTPLATPSITISQGASTGSFEYKDTLAGTPTLTVAATGLTSAMQQETVNAATSSQVVFTTAAQTLTAGQPSAPMTVKLEDQFGNAVLAGTGGQVLNLSSTSAAGSFLDTTGTPLATPSITIAQGASTGSFEYKDTLAGTPTLTVAATGLTSATQQETVNAATSSQVVFTTAAQTLTAGQPSAPMTVKLEDQFGNAVVASTGGQVLNLSSTSAAGTFLNTSGIPLAPPSITIAQGASTGSFEYKDTLAGTPTLTVAATGLTSATQQETVNAATSSQVVFTTAAQTLTAGQPSAPMTVKLEDQFGNAVLAGTGGQVLNLSSTSAAGTFLNTSGIPLAPPSITIAQGASTGSFEYKDTLAGTPTLTVAATGLTSATQQETVNATTSSQVVFTTAAQTLTAGQPSAPMTVKLEDQFGNAVVAGTGGQVLNLSSTSAAGAFLDTTGTPLATPSITIAQGASTGSFEYKDTLVGTPTLTVAATGLTSATQQETVNAATASQVVFTTAAQTLTAGQPSAPMTVKLEDQFGNAVLAGTGGQVLNLSSTSAAGSFLDTTGTPLATPSITIAQGASTGSFEYEDTLAGTPTLTVAATGLTSATQQETVNPGPFSLSQSTVSVVPSTILEGATATVTLTARDAFGNQESSGGLTVTFGLGTGTAAGTFSAVTDNNNGTYAATFTGTGAGTNTITATINAGQVTSTPPTITVRSPITSPFFLGKDNQLYAWNTATNTTVNTGGFGLQLSVGQDAAGNTFAAVRDGNNFVWIYRPNNATPWLDTGGQAIDLVSASNGVVFIRDGNNRVLAYALAATGNLTQGWNDTGGFALQMSTGQTQNATSPFVAIRDGNNRVYVYNTAASAAQAWTDTGGYAIDLKAGLEGDVFIRDANNEVHVFTLTAFGALPQGWTNTGGFAVEMDVNFDSNDDFLAVRDGLNAVSIYTTFNGTWQNTGAFAEQLAAGFEQVSIRDGRNQISYLNNLSTSMTTFNWQSTQAYATLLRDVAPGSPLNRLGFLDGNNTMYVAQASGTAYNFFNTAITAKDVEGFDRG